MPKKDAKEQLSQLLKKQEVIKHRIASLEAREKRDADKKLTRKKILTGAYFLEQYEKKNELAKLGKLLDGFLTRNSDRALFDLPQVEKKDAVNE